MVAKESTIQNVEGKAVRTAVRPKEPTMNCIGGQDEVQREVRNEVQNDVLN